MSSEGLGAGAISAKSLQVVITGASRGMGKAIAETFASHGHHLFLTSRNDIALYQTVQELQTRYPGITIRAKAFDFAETNNAIAFGKWVLGYVKAADILVNNAGVFLPGSIHTEEAAVMEQQMQLNFFSAYHLTRVLLTGMKAARSGHIFNMSSIAALGVYPAGSSYSISKYALTGFSKNLRHEMKPFGIKVTTIYPGAVYTDSWEASGIDPKRIMEAGDVAAMVYAASRLSPQACVEELVLRPQPGDV